MKPSVVTLLAAAIFCATAIAPCGDTYRQLQRGADGAIHQELLRQVLSYVGPRPAHAFAGGTALGLTPADASGAVSDSYVVSALNNGYYFYNRSGTLLKFRNGNGFWCGGPNAPPNGCPGTFFNPTTAPLITFDPQILYEAAKGRWVTSALGATSSELAAGTWMPVTYLAVSTTADPTGSWIPYFFQSCADGRPGDQPKLGIDGFADWIVVEHSLCANTVLGTQNLSVFVRSALYSGIPPQASIQTLISDPNDMDRPVVSYSTADFGREWLVDSIFANDGTPELLYSFLQPDTNGRSVLTSSAVLVAVPSLGPATFVIPPGSDPRCSACIATRNDARVQSATVQRLANGHTAVVTPLAVRRTDGSTGVTSLVLDVSSLSIPLAPVFRSHPAETIMYPSSALTSAADALTLQFGFTSGSPSGAYPSDYAYVLGTTDGLIKKISTKEGAAADVTSNRWGDYSTVVPDVANSQAAWALGSFLNGAGNQDQWWMQVTSGAGAGPEITSIPAVILVGDKFQVHGTGFTFGSVANFFVSTATGAVNAGPLATSGSSATLLTIPVPPPPR